MLSTDEWRAVALIFLAVGQTLFALLYMTFPWWRSFLGRALFYKAVALATVLDIGLFARLNPKLTDWDPIFIVLYFILGTGVWFQFSAFLHIAFTSRREDWDMDKQRADERQALMDARDVASESRETAMDERGTTLDTRQISQDQRESHQDTRDSSQDSRESSQDSRDSEWSSRGDS